MSIAIQNRLSLFENAGKSKAIRELPIDDLQISPYNPRKNRSDEAISKLAERINRNGYEITRALWVYPNGSGYHVFAGGTRFLAAQAAGVDMVPCVVHDGYTDEEIVRLADEDNENDEYHEPVGLVDMWSSYKALADQGWTQERIAEAKGASRTFVSFRLRLADSPDWLHQIVTKENWNEGICREFLPLLHCNNPRLLRRAADECLSRKTLTAKHANEIVQRLIAFGQHVEDTAKTFGKETFYHFETEPPSPYEWDARATYLAKIESGEVYTIANAKRVEHEVRREVARERGRYADYLTAKADAEAELAAKTKPIEVKRGEWWELGTHLLYCGDTSGREFHAGLSGAFAFADPPYNEAVADWDEGFEWAHDWLIDAAPIVAVTPGISAIFNFARKTRMPYVWSVSCWIDNGMTRGALGFGNWIYAALFSGESIHRNAQDLIRVSITPDEKSASDFKGRKPLAFIRWLVETFTQAGDVVIDPFAGSGTTLFACEQTGRKCVTGELEPKHCEDIIREWQDSTGQLAMKREK